VNLTLRSRLTLVYAGVFGTVLIALAIASFRAFAYQLDADVTANLMELTSGLHGYVRFIGGAPSIVFDSTDPAQAAFVAEATRYYAVFDVASGELITQSDAFAPLGLEFTTAEVRQFRDAPVNFDVQTDYGRVRLSNSVITQPGGHQYLLQVGASLAAMDHVLHRFTVLLMVSVPAALLIATAVGRWMAGVALRPLTRVAEAARPIDITDLQRRLPVRGANDELDAVANAFNDTLARLERAVAEMRQFSTALAHEIRTPLAALRSGIETAMLERPGEEAQRRLAGQLEEIDKLKRMIGQILTVARAEAGEIRLARSTVDVGAIVSSIVEQVEPVAAAKGVELSCERAEAVLVEGDAEWLKRVVLNLLDNAIKFTLPGGRVVIAVERQDGSAHVTVRDSGLGIPEDAQPQIFEPFFRADPARSIGGDGVGLGLSLARWIVARHNGTIDVKSAPGHGSTFTVRLPVASPQAIKRI
jgi:heavy metal sensor kinase